MSGHDAMREAVRAEIIRAYGPAGEEAAADTAYGKAVTEMRLKEEAFGVLMRERAQEIAADLSGMLPEGMRFEWAPSVAPSPEEVAASMARLAESIPVRPKRAELHCHPLVVTWLRMTTPEAGPSFPGAIGNLTGIPVIESPELGPGEWELREDGEMVKSGKLGT